MSDVIVPGGLFHPEDDKQEVAFRYAVERVNADRAVLPRAKLLAQVETISPQDSFHASKRVCHLLRSGVAAIFGPQSAPAAAHVQSICDTMELPHLETRWDYRTRRESCLVNLYPHPAALSRAYVDLVRAWGWKSFTIVYENSDGLVRLQEPLLKQIKNSAESHIVLDCATERIRDVLQQAQQIGMMSDYHSYLITSLDLHSVDLEEFKYGGTNITALRLLDPERSEVQRVVRDWVYDEARKGRKLQLGHTSAKTETALMYDAVHLFAKALHDLDTSQQIDVRPLSCEAEDTWPHGYSLINYMKISAPYCMRKEASEKLTGNAQFEGYGIDLIHEISKVLGFNYTFKLAPDGRYGSFNRETKEEQVVDFTMPFMNLGISVLYRKPIKQPPNLFSFLSPLSLDVWIYMATAYLGVSVLLFILARFTPYEWHETRTTEGEKMENIFSLANCLWFAIGSLMQQSCDFLPKFSPYEWDSPRNCIDEPPVLENQFTLLNSLWFTIGSLMQQGSDIAPKAIKQEFLFVDSPYRTAISGAVLKLQEEGKLHILKTKWWKEKRGGGSCRASLCSEMASELRSALKCPSGGSGTGSGTRDGADSPYLHYGFSTKSQLH
ncbi:unnamed protein product [Leptidea sinapis]|uniref:Ionotropic glutamate receptor C-terminal domain-containing protein n=1 Tax=Leptidea sinapis TaxID=189913 RepID=A0A5E4R9V5_9NEOP|nr:unnamed protein product [Leptidea sinapis]